MESSVRDVALNTTSNAVNKSVGLANGGVLNDTVTKVREGWEIDYTVSPAAYTAFQNGVQDTVSTWTPVEATPWILNSSPSAITYLGNNGLFNSVLFMEVVAGIVLAEIPSVDRRTAIDSYLASL